MAKRDRTEICRAVIRLNADGELVPLEQLRDRAEASEKTLQRWAIEGKRGVFLDAVHRPGKGWVSSWAALARFQRKLAQLPQLPTPPQPQRREPQRWGKTSRRLALGDRLAKRYRSGAANRLRSEQAVSIPDLVAQGVAELPTLESWIHHGIPTPDGGRLHLDGEQRDGVWWTSTEALTRFLDGMDAVSGESSAHHELLTASAEEGGVA